MNGGPFFVGWNAASARGLGRVLVPVSVGFAVGLGLLGAVLGGTVEDPAASLIALAPGPAPAAGFVPGEHVLTGVMTADPYPVLHVAATPEHPQGRALLMTGDGKVGVPYPPEAFGRVVTLSGGLFRRGEIEMLLPRELVFADGRAVAPPVPVPLGRWRIVGEVCDGKCTAGLMAPGSGLSHRACATLCFAGEVPMILVAAAPVAGRSFLLIAGADGGRPPEALRDLVGLPVVLEGEVERHGTLLVLRADLARAERL